MSSVTPADDPAARRKRAGRKYTSRACEECRRRRAKCDGTRPSCARCLDRGVRCQYSTAEDGRQPAPKSYVVMLRNRIELLERILQAHGIDADSSVAELMAESDSPNQPTDSSCAAGSSNLEDLCGTFDGALTLDESLNFDQDGEVRFFGPTSGRLLFRSSANGENTLSSDGASLINEGSPNEEAYQADTSGSGYFNVSCENTPYGSDGCLNICPGSNHCPHDSSIPISQELQNHLIDLYFEWEQPWFQVVNETLFRESLACGGRYCSPLLLNCILALGSRYCDRLEVRSDPLDPNTAGKMFISEAEKLIQNDLRWPKITTIQSLSIMGMVYIAMGSDAAGWLHQGMANRLALDMGFNMDPSVLAEKVSLPPIEIELRRQVYWALYCHDKLSASYTGRVCTLLDCQGAVNKPYLKCASDRHLPSTNGQPRASSPRDVVQLHRAMIDLCRILEKILLSLWSPKPLLHAHQRSAFFESCILELKTWYYDLPSELKIDRATGPSRFAHAYTLSMVYHTAYILLCGPFMTALSHLEVSNNHNNHPQANEGKNTPEHTRTQKAISACSASVRSICIVAQKYKQTFGSFRLSPITATHCTLSAALIIIERCCATDNKQSKRSPNDEPHRALSPHAAVGLLLQVLRELSTSWNISKRIGRNLEKVYCQRFGGDHLPSPPQGCDMVAGETASQVVDNTTVFDAAPPVESFDGLFNDKNMLFDDPLSLQLQAPLVSAPDAVSTFDSGHTETMPYLPPSHETFANNMGFAFEPDSLPSDYNMFDTLNQMYLEDTW